jgi:type IX secretion system PorP/SprF family membrane protein
MQRSNIKYILIGIMLMAFSRVSAQQYTYTQYMDDLTPINSAFTLVKPGAFINTLVRKQWVGIPGAPTTYMLDGAFPVASVNGSVGLNAMNSVFAIEHLTTVNGFFAKAIQLNDSYKLAVSMNVGLRTYMANYSSVNATDPEFATNISETRPNVGFGAMLYTDVYFVGVSVPQIDVRTLGNASLQESNFRNTYYLTAGYSSGIGNDLKFRNVGLLEYSRQVPLVFNLSSTMVVKEVFDIGVNYRSTNEVAGIISANFNSYHVGYSYEFGTTSSNIGGYSNASHEVTLGYRFGK